MNVLRFVTSISLVVFAVSQTGAQGTRGTRSLSFDDFAAVRALSDPQVSPDGRLVLYAVRTVDMDANRRTTRTYVMPLTGGGARQFPNDSVNAAEARWSPDGRKVAYVAGGQLWIADADGGGRRQLSTLTGGASGPVWAPTGDRIAFASAVYPACRDDACNARREKEKEANKVKAHIATELLYRHWTA